jgi:hypothetical protein
MGREEVCLCCFFFSFDGVVLGLEGGADAHNGGD